jgi:hypothetical protein
LHDYKRDAAECRHPLDKSPLTIAAFYRTSIQSVFLFL